MKFIHCSDLHLDSRMESNLPPEKARERSRELLHTFARLTRYAAQNDVRAVIIAGDFFDTARTSASTVAFVLDAVRQEPEVDFLYLRGNHDEGGTAFSAAALPDNFRFFGGEWTSFDYGDAVITGTELTAENCRSCYDTLRLDPARLNLVTLHGQVSGQRGEDLVCLPDLKNRGIDYLALGHLHSFQGDKLDLRGHWCYSGCLEGRGFDECGTKGFVLLECTNGRIHPRFVPFGERALHEVLVDISGLTETAEMERAARAAARQAEIPAEAMVKFTLTGSCTLETRKEPALLQKLLSDGWYFVRVKDESELSLPKEDYTNDISLKGAFLRRVMAADLPPERKEEIIRCGLRALSGEEVD